MLLFSSAQKEPKSLLPGTFLGLKICQCFCGHDFAPDPTGKLQHSRHPQLDLAATVGAGEEKEPQPSKRNNTYLCAYCFCIANLSCPINHVTNV